MSDFVVEVLPQQKSPVFTVEDTEGNAIVDVAASVPSFSFDVVGGTGPRGPAGPPGNGVGFDFVQSSPSSTWTINHNLGFRPMVTLFTVGGVEMFAEITHTSDNQVVVSFVQPTAGSARCI